MRPTRIGTLLMTAVVCGVLAWLLLRVLYDVLPALPWTGVPALLVLALAEAWSGFLLRSRLRGKRVGGKPMAPIAVARLAALAKASSLTAAIIGGLAAGFAIYVSSSLDKPAYAADLPPAAGTFGAAVILVLAALYLEYNCRVPTSGDQRDGRPGGSEAPPRRQG